MIRLNKEQSEWMERNFLLSKYDLPSHFYCPETLIETICNTYDNFRGEDYSGNSQSFVDDCLLSLFATPSNKKKFERLFSQLQNYWIVKAKEMEYYELASNLNEINNEFIRFVQSANSHQVDNEVYLVLNELGIERS
jgi:hypothetical protein